MKRITTISDLGSVKVGTDDFTILIPNGYGDGNMTVFLAEKDEEIPSCARYFTFMQGKAINIYSYDGNDNTVEETLEEGRYGIYILGNTEVSLNRGAVIFQKW